MGLMTQAYLDQLGALARQTDGRWFLVRWLHKEDPTDIAVAKSLLLKMEGYSANEISLGLVLLNDQQGLIQATLIDFVPSLYDETIWIDGTRWRVLNVKGGPQVIWYNCRLQQIG